MYETVEIIISKFIDSKNKTAYVHYFLDIVIERDLRNQSGISDFLKYWDKNIKKMTRILRKRIGFKFFKNEKNKPEIQTTF